MKNALHYGQVFHRFKKVEEKMIDHFDRNNRKSKQKKGVNVEPKEVNNHGRLWTF